MKTYVTFGQEHAHRVNGKFFDKDCVAVIETETALEGRNRAVELFGLKFFTSYPEYRWTAEKLAYFPRGYLSVADHQ